MPSEPTTTAAYGSPGPAHEVVHRCPHDGSGLMPCCGRTPFEVPRYHRMTVDPKLVTCGVTGIHKDPATGGSA